LAATKEEAKAFIQKWAAEGAEVARNNSLPVSAMLACACAESAYGKGSIYLATQNPFSLQKWPSTNFPVTHRIHWSQTQISTDPDRYLRAPFNCAKDSPDAVRQWCEWILHYGAADGPPGNPDPKVHNVHSPTLIANRQKLLAVRDDGYKFCYNLPLVGFGENSTHAKRVASGQGYQRVYKQYSLGQYDRPDR
jgi:hypothetical protein